jgi:hypothetical protein
MSASEKTSAAPEKKGATPTRQLPAADRLEGLSGIGPSPSVAGNLAVQRLLQGRVILPKLETGSPADPLEREAAAAAERCSRGGSCRPAAGSCDGCRHHVVQRKAAAAPSRAPAFVQAKLPVSQPGDPAEAEADRMAEAAASGAPIPSCAGVSCPGGGCSTCGRSSGIRRKRQPGSGAAPPAAAAGILPRSGGRPLEPAVRAEMEASFGEDFSAVRVHTGGEAAASAKSIRALAYTAGSDVVFDSGRYAPETGEGRKLLAHELAHVTQQASAGEPGRIMRTAAEDTISSYTHYLNLDEEGLGRHLLARALAGAYSEVTEVFETLGSTDRDDVAYELCHRATDDELTQISNAEGGRRLLDRLYDELTSGSVADEELEQADRIMRIKASHITPAEMEASLQNPKIFPFRLPGLTVFSDAPISAERRSGGRIWVHQPVRVLGTDEFRGETSTLPTETFLDGIEIPENEIIGVRMYDLGGEIQFRPALFLIQLANTTDTTILSKMGEAAFIGLTLGSGSLVAGAGELTMAARAVLWADRIAFALGTMTSIIREHRGEILAWGGERGATFLRYVDTVNSVVAIYGGIRGLVGMVQLVNSFRTAFQEWNALRQSLTLAEEESRNASAIARNTEDVLRNIDDATAAAPNTGNVIQFPAGGRGGTASPTTTATTTTPVTTTTTSFRMGTSGDAYQLAPSPVAVTTPAVRAVPSDLPNAQVIPIRPNLVPNAPPDVVPAVTPPVSVTATTPSPLTATPTPTPRTVGLPPLNPAIAGGLEPVLMPPSADLELSADPDPLTGTAPQPEREPAEELCFSAPTPRRGGFARHDRYAVLVSHSLTDYYVRSPRRSGELGINYDGLTPPIQVWEVKVGYSRPSFRWMLYATSPFWIQRRDQVLARWDSQKNRGISIAQACGYTHVWSIPNPEIATMLSFRWGGNPPVLSIPEGGSSE